MNMPLALLNRRRRIGGFSPSALFALAEPGVYFDPSDVANLDWRRNLLTWTEQFDNASWSKVVGATVSANTAVAPDGTTTADTISFNTTNGNRVEQSGGTAINGETLTVSMWLKGTGTINLNVGTDTGVGGSGETTITLTSSWVRYSTSVTLSSPTGSRRAMVIWRTGNTATSVDVWGAQLELGSVATDYQPILADLNTEVIERFPTATLYQDTAGTIPVTTTGQSVGLMLDKSKGLVLGPELVTNGDFSSGTGWTLGSGWAISGGQLVGSSVPGFVSTTQATTSLVAGKTYEVTYDVTSFTSGAVRVIFPGGTQATGVSRVSVGSFREVIVANVGNDRIGFGSGSVGFTGVVDNISVKELPGNHAVQATTANRPIYGVHPFGGRRNLLLRTEEFDNAYWSKVGTTAISANTTAAPDGNLTADTMSGASGNPATTSTNTLERVATVASSTTYTFSCYVAGAGSGTIRATLRDASTGAVVSTDQSLSGSFSRVSVTITTGAATTQVNVRLGNTSGNVVIWGAQLETGSTATAYQRVTDQYNVTEAGVSSVSYLFFDGVNDSLATPTITPGVDKAQVFAGVRKLSDAAGMIVESSASLLANNGTFNLDANASGAGRYRFISKGTALSQAFSGVIATPSSEVISGIGDISGDNSTLRVDGTQAATSATDQGTGNYGNFPLYIGARAGTSLFFSGHLYSLIARFGPNLDTGQISSTETWVASRTGITI